MAPKKEAGTSTALKERPKASKNIKQAEFLLQAQPPTSCCKGTSSCSTSASTPNKKAQEATTLIPPSEVKKGPKTRIIVKYDVGYANQLYVRGKGANLSWNHGIPLKNIKADEWIWETDSSFKACEFKVLINDQQYEGGQNHPLACGASIQYTPNFDI